MGLSADALVHLRTAELPVKSVWIPEGSAVHWMLVTVPENWRDQLPGVSSEEFAQRVGETLFKTDSMVWLPQVYLVDEDIDPTNMADVMWALATRVHPTKRRCVFPDQRLTRLSVCYGEEEHSKSRGDKVVFDTLLSSIAEGRDKHASFDKAYPEELKVHVLKNWGK